MHTAAWSGRFDLFQRMMERGGMPHKPKNQQGATPMDVYGWISYLRTWRAICSRNSLWIQQRAAPTVVRTGRKRHRKKTNNDADRATTTGLFMQVLKHRLAQRGISYSDRGLATRLLACSPKSPLESIVRRPPAIQQRQTKKARKRNRRRRKLVQHHVKFLDSTVMHYIQSKICLCLPPTATTREIKKDVCCQILPNPPKKNSNTSKDMLFRRWLSRCKLANARNHQTEKSVRSRSNPSFASLRKRVGRLFGRKSVAVLDKKASWYSVLYSNKRCCVCDG